MGNVNTCDKSFEDPFEYYNHVKSCVVNNDNNDKDFNPLNLFFNKHTNVIIDLPSTPPTNHVKYYNTRACQLCYQLKSISDWYKRKYKCKSCLKQKITCPQCNVLVTEYNLSRHIKEVHHDKINVQCLTCHKTYNKKYFIDHKCVILY